MVNNMCVLDLPQKRAFEANDCMQIFYLGRYLREQKQGAGEVKPKLYYSVAWSQAIGMRPSEIHLMIFSMSIQTLA